jgi:hypothetical protein
MTGGGVWARPPPGPESGVRLRLKIFPLAFLFLLCKPRLHVDGGEQSTLIWGENLLALPPGSRTLRCYVPYLWYRHVGDSTFIVEVTSGSVQQVQWRTPWLVFLKGTWKTAPQP